MEVLRDGLRLFGIGAAVFSPLVCAGIFLVDGWREGISRWVLLASVSLLLVASVIFAEVLLGPGPPWALMAAGAASLTGISLFLYVSIQKRMQAYQDYCLTRGYSFWKEGGAGMSRYGDVVPIFREGNDRSWKYEIRGRYQDHEFTLFEYSHSFGIYIDSPSDITVYTYAFAMWKDQPVSLKFLLDERDREKWGEERGMKPISLGQASGFGSSYRLLVSDDKARALFGGFFAPTPGIRAAAGDGVLFYWRRGGLPGASQLDAFLRESDSFRRRLVGSARAMV